MKKNRILLTATVLLLPLSLTYMVWAMFAGPYGYIYDGPGHSWDTFIRVKYITEAFSGDKMFLVGNSIGAGSGIDIFSIASDTMGNEVWLNRFNGTGNGKDSAIASFKDADNNLYIVGETREANNQINILFAKYSAAGQVIFIKKYDNNLLDDIPTAATIDTLGNVFIYGYSKDQIQAQNRLLIKYNENGIRLYAKILDLEGSVPGGRDKIEIDKSNKTLVTTDAVPMLSNPNMTAIRVKQYLTKNGNLKWTYLFEPDTIPRTASSMVLNNLGDIFIVGDSYGGLPEGCEWFLLNITKRGQLKWYKDLTTNPITDSPSPIVFYCDNPPYDLSVFVKYVGAVNLHSESIRTARYDNNGNLIWQNNFLIREHCYDLGNLLMDEYLWYLVGNLLVVDDGGQDFTIMGLHDMTNGSLIDSCGSADIEIRDMHNFSSTQLILSGNTVGVNSDSNDAFAGVYTKLYQTNKLDKEHIFDIPHQFSLNQNYPNPFNPATTIKYSIAEGSDVVLKIYDVLGKEVATLVNEYRSTGNYDVEFNAVNLPSGIYFYKLQAGSYTETKKMLLLK